MAFSNKTDAAELKKLSLNELSESIASVSKYDKKQINEALDTKVLFVGADQANEAQELGGTLKPLFGGQIYSASFKNAKETAVAYKVLDSKKSNSSFTMLNLKLLKKSSVSYEGWGTRTMSLDKYRRANSTCSNTLKIGVLDTGINPDHEAFTDSTARDRVLFSQGYDYYNDDSSSYDDDGHGTMVSGTITQSTPSCVKIVPIKVLGSDGNGDGSALFGALDDIYAGNYDVDIINMSLGQAYDDFDWENKTTEINNMFNVVNNAFSYIRNVRHIIPIAAAGNESSPVGFPALLSNVIAVSSVNRNDEFSSDFSCFGSEVEFSAPGEDLILPAYDENDAYYQNVSGTSFSSPYTAAAFANVKVAHPSWSNVQIYENVKLNTIDRGATGHDQYYGYGSIHFNVNEFADITITATEGNYGKTVNVSLAGTSTQYNITHYKVLNGNRLDSNEAISWESVATAGKTVNQTYTASANGTYTVWFKNSNGEFKGKTFTVTKVDTTAPSITKSLSAAQVSNTTNVKLSIEADDVSGISKIEWFYKATGQSAYISETDNYPVGTAATTKTHTFNNLAAGSYTAYAVVTDRAGNNSRSGDINFTIVALENPTQPGGDNTDPTNPDDGDTDPTNPDDGDTDPTNPDDGDTDPTQPGDDNTDPTNPDDGDSSDTPSVLPEAGNGNNGGNADTTLSNPKTADPIAVASIAGGVFTLAAVAFLARNKRR